MKIAEMFYSLQGEGLLAGVPSVFVRTSGCNLRCSWCDTPYASWRPEGSEWTLDEISTYVRKQRAAHTVLTGGEPMIHPGIVELSERLRSEGQHITVETAGTVFEPVACDLISISPKMSNSTPHDLEGGRWVDVHDRLRYRPDVIQELMRAYPYQLKFVVKGNEDLDEIQALIRELQPEPYRVLLMPEGTRVDTLNERSRWLAEVCKDLGFRFCTRLHILLWGDRRGV